MNIVPLTLAHLAGMRVQEAQKRDGFYALDTYRNAGECFAGVVGGKPVFCVGRAHGNRAWAILSEDARSHMLAVTRAIKDLIRQHGNGYLEILIRPDFEQGHRWATILGFTQREYDPDYGSYIYARGVDFAGEVEKITALLSCLPAPVRCEPEVVNTFSDGLYTRRMFIPKGTLIVGKVHLRETLNICAKGDITILTEKGLARFVAGDVIVSSPGVQKIGFAHEDTVWVNVFATPETDLKKLEAEIVCDPPNDSAKKFMKMIREAA